MSKKDPTHMTINTDAQALKQFQRSGLGMNQRSGLGMNTSKKRGKKGGGLPGFKMPKTGLPSL